MVQACAFNFTTEEQEIFPIFLFYELGNRRENRKQTESENFSERGNTENFSELFSVLVVNGWQWNEAASRRD